jgi:hypothetical protein
MYSKVVNLPTLNTPYLIRILDPAAPLVLHECLIKPVATNSGAMAIGGPTMATVDDGNRLEVGEGNQEAGSVGIAVDTSATYLIADANNSKVLIQGKSY